MTTAVQNIETYLEAFTRFTKEAAGRDLPWLRKLREDSFEHFCETGFPTPHDEDWRFTNVSAIARTPFSLARPDPISIAELDLNRWKLEKAVRLVFVDGQFVPELSSIGGSRGVTVSSLKEKLAKEPEQLEAHLGRYLDIRRDPFCALNTAFAEDGAFVRVARGVSVEEPIHLLFVASGNDAPVMMHPRNLLLVDSESEVTIIEEYVSLADSTTLSNSATELVIGESSTASHYRIEREHPRSFHVSTLRMHLGRSANVSAHSLLLGGGLVRNNVHPVLAGEGGECLINGLFVGSGLQHLDNYMHVEHASPHSSSRQFYNGILDGQAHGVFHGRIVVHRDAQKTDAKQTNRNLLLSDDAQIDTKPQLEIYADDVKCTHGATIGQIDENALFYLRSRGVEEVAARRLLLSAFANECLERMKPGTARSHAGRVIDERLLSVAHPSPVEPGVNKNRSERNWEEVG